MDCQCMLIIFNISFLSRALHFLLLRNTYVSKDVKTRYYSLTSTSTMGIGQEHRKWLNVFLQFLKEYEVTL